MLLFLILSVASVIAYDVSCKRISNDPLLSWVRNTSTFRQVFNPSWVQATSRENGREGILVRTQDCASDVGGTCIHCSGSGPKASFLTFSEFDRETNTLSPVGPKDIVFGPHDSTDSFGTEDPRIQFNHLDNLYYMFYTAYNGSSIFLSLATTENPTDPKGWQHHGPVFPSIGGSKSGALLIRDNGPHYLFWGDSDIRVVKSADPKKWPSAGGSVFLTPRQGYFDSGLVESGPPPMRLKNGDYLFFYNSAVKETNVYHPAWVILDGEDPSKILQRARVPLLSPLLPWELGTKPYTCNVGNVIFLEAAVPIGDDDFLVFYGGADAVIGAARCTVTK